MNRRIAKILAGTVMLSMALGMTGCSKEGKFTAKRYESVILDDLEAVQYEIDDIDFDDPEEFAADLAADLEDGIFITMTGEDLMDSDFYDEDIFDILYAVMNIDLDYENVESTSLYLRAEMEDEDDFYFIMSSVLELDSNEASKNYYSSVINNAKRYIKIANAVCDTELSLDEMDKDYFKYNGGNSGHFIVKISLDDIDIDELDDLDFEATLVVASYIEGKDIHSVICVCADPEGNDVISEYFDSFKMKNPFEFEEDEMIIDFINDVIKNSDKIAKKWVKKFENYSSLADSRF